jgi:nitrite reductase/ring-hydroxylating ferredoxin subunit
MKKHLLLLAILPFFFGCSNSSFNNNNPYLPNYTFTIDINMNLPAYSNLQYPSNAIYYAGQGIRGVYVFNTGSGYNAFEAACPNQALSACSTMTLKGINVVCSCDNNEYSLFTGLSQGGSQYPLKQYRVEVNGTILRVYN